MRPQVTGVFPDLIARWTAFSSRFRGEACTTDLGVTMDVVANTEDIRRVGTACASAASQAATAGCIEQAPILAAAVPVYGPLGMDFTMSLAQALANNLQSTQEWAHVQGCNAQAHFEAAGSYAGTDDASAAGIQAI